MNESQRICRFGLVSGVVQGVGFRAFVRSVAEPAGLNGYARNLQDGRVAVLLCGERAALEAVQAQVAQGPRTARVQDVRWEDCDDEAVSGFSCG